MKLACMLVIILAALHIAFSVGDRTCGKHEYLTDENKCCPMCKPGSYVLRHCDEFSSPACMPCPSSSFTDVPNGLLQCKSCTACDSKLGLKVGKACISTSDTLCEPLEGHYCSNPNKDGCRAAAKHSECSTGQYIEQKGTASSDTVCANCDNATCANGSISSCNQLSQCGSRPEVSKKGTSLNGWNNLPYNLRAAIIVGIAVVGVMIAFCFWMFGLYSKAFAALLFVFNLLINLLPSNEERRRNNGYEQIE